MIGLPVSALVMHIKIIFLTFFKNLHERILANPVFFSGIPLEMFVRMNFEQAR